MPEKPKPNRGKRGIGQVGSLQAKSPTFLPKPRSEPAGPRGSGGAEGERGQAWGVGGGSQKWVKKRGKRDPGRAKACHHRWMAVQTTAASQRPSPWPLGTPPCRVGRGTLGCPCPATRTPRTPPGSLVARDGAGSGHTAPQRGGRVLPTHFSGAGRQGGGSVGTGSPPLFVSEGCVKFFFGERCGA